MKHKKFVKQLMALGIQRNDAAGFVKAARIIQDKGMGHMVPDLVFDMPVPIIVSKREIITFEARITNSMEWERCCRDAEEKTEYIKRRLGAELGKGLLASGLCEIAAITDISAHAIVYRARIDVAVPREVQP